MSVTTNLRYGITVLQQTGSFTNLAYNNNCIYCNEEVNITHALFTVNKSKGSVTKLKFLQKI